jgi:hypothetical protein
MARTKSKPITRAAKPKSTAPKKQDTPQPKTVDGIDSGDLVSLLNSRIGESTTYWNGREYNLEKATKDNESLYLGRQVSDRDDGTDNDLSLDNRIFSSIRTIVPFVTTRITEPEVYPSSNSQEAKKFAEDFERALHSKADKENVKAKVKFAIEDAIIRRRGYLKPRYDAATQNFCSIEYVPCESIIIDHKAKAYEEARYFRHVLDKTVEDLIEMFPEMKKQIYDLFNIKDDSDRKQLQTSHQINEDWSFVPLQGELDLVVCWSYNETALGVIQDPNWRYGKSNFLTSHMMPLVEFNVISDGRTHIDKTSFVEQAKYLQATQDKRAEQISKNAGLGSVGMPVVDAGALAEDQSQFLTYEEDTVIELDVPDGKGINDVFTKWQANPLPSYIFESQQDARQGVDNTFGTSNITRGEQSDNNTLGQDVLLRDQAQGRQQEIVDAIDGAMGRLYLLMAQFMLVYGTEQELFRYVGEDAQFDYLIMNSDNLDTNAEIRVKAGTSMPIDKSQQRATADKAATQKMISPLDYWEIMDQPNAQKRAKNLMDFMADPVAFLKDVQEDVFSRDAYVDIELIKLGQTPPFREDLEKSYFDYLNQYALSGALDSPKLDPETKQMLMDFMNIQLQRGQKKVGMLETQLPTPDDVQAHNQQVDEANAAAPPPDAAAGGAKPAPNPTAPVTKPV